MLCRRCSEEKHVTEFYRHAHKRNGVRTWCKPCVSAYNKDARVRRKSGSINRVGGMLKPVGTVSDVGDKDVGWLAGMVDGEGSINLYEGEKSNKPYVTPRQR